MNKHSVAYLNPDKEPTTHQWWDGLYVYERIRFLDDHDVPGSSIIGKEQFQQRKVEIHKKHIEYIKALKS